MSQEQIAVGSSEVIVLLSGGLDSSACVCFYSSQGFVVDTLFIDYGQPAATDENEAAVAISSHYGTTHRIIHIDGSSRKGSGVIRGRNAFLLISALAESRSGSGLIVIGIHDGTQYPDCSPQFISTIQGIYDLYCDGRVIAAAPFVNWSKREIWEYCRTHKVPIELTYSCQTGGKPCGSCDSCLDRKLFYAL
jgi:7-cyano-7-deazaguanine synthase